MTSVEPNEFVLVYFPSKKKLIGLALLAAMFVVFGGVFIAVGLSTAINSIFLLILGFVCVTFFGFSLVYMLGRLINKKPSIILTDDGIVDDSSFISGGSLKWTEIEDILLFKYMGKDFIGLKLYDLNSYMAKQSVWKRLFMNVNNRMVHAPINIAGSTLTIPLMDLFNKMEESWSRALQTSNEGEK